MELEPAIGRFSSIVDFTLDFTFFFRNLVELPELSVIIRFTVLSNQTNQFDETNTTFMLTFNTSKKMCVKMTLYFSLSFIYSDNVTIYIFTIYL